MKKKSISTPVVRRIPRYYRHLEALNKKGVPRISSAELAKRTGLTPSQIRQDLACFGEFGQQGYGYSVTELMNELAGILAMTDHLTAVMVGTGRLGKALLENFPFKKYGINLIAAYDINPNVIGSNICGVPVYHSDKLPTDLIGSSVDIAILTAPVETAHSLTDVLSSGGVKGIWNFTNAELRPRNKNTTIENVHLFDSLFSLCCLIKENDHLAPFDN